MDALLFLPLANALGVSVNFTKLLSCLLIAYPLGSLFVRVPSSATALRHLFNIIVAIIFFFLNFRIYSTFFQLLASILATYFVAKYHKGKSMPWVVFVIVMGHLTVNQVICAVNGPTPGMQVNTSQTVLTMKLTTFAWNVYDGRRKVEELDKWQTAKKITKYPSLLEFLGYSSVLLPLIHVLCRKIFWHAIRFYFPGVLIGPCLDFQEYIELINETMFQSAEVKAKVRPGCSLPPGRKRAGYTKMLFAIVYFGTFMLCIDKYNCEITLEPEFMKYSLSKRILLYQLVGLVERLRFYAFGMLTEGACILTGLGFTGLNAKGEPQWDGAANFKVMQIEFAPNLKLLVDAWNVKTNVWLRECVYKRVTPKGKKPGFRSIMVTSFTSALWHGMHGGYYLMFFTIGIATAAARLARSDIRPLLLPPPSNPSAPPSLLKRIYDLFGILLTVSVSNYAAAPFIILSTRDSLLAWNNLGWYGHIIVMGGLMFFYAGGSTFLRGLQKAKGILPSGTSTKAAASLQNGTSTALVEKTLTLPPSVDTPPIS